MTASDRKARLGAALRQNLRKRKAQAADRREEAPAARGGAETAASTEGDRRDDPAPGEPPVRQ